MRTHEGFGNTGTVEVDPWGPRADALQPGWDPFGPPPSKEVASWASQASGTGTEPSLPRGWDPFGPKGQDTLVSPENTAERPRNVLQRVGSKIVKIVELSGMVSGGLSRGAEAIGRAGNLVGKMAPGSRLHNTLNTTTGYMETGAVAATGVGNVYTAATSAWNSREQVAQSALDYGRGAGMRVAGAGAQAAIDVIAKRTGVSLERDEGGNNKLKVRKIKLAKFALKVVLTGAAVIPKVSIEAVLAAREAVKKGAVGEYKAAKQNGVDMARDIAFAGYNPFAPTGNVAPATGVNTYNNDGW